MTGTTRINVSQVQAAYGNFDPNQYSQSVKLTPKAKAVLEQLAGDQWEKAMFAEKNVGGSTTFAMAIFQPDSVDEVVVGSRGKVFATGTVQDGNDVVDWIPSSGIAAPRMNNKVDPTDPCIKLGMYEKLLKAGISEKTIVTNINHLTKPGAEAKLIGNGFKAEQLSGPSDGSRSYVCGGVEGLYGVGQRVVFSPDGSITLMSLEQGSESKQIIEVIDRDKDGKITHSVTGLD